MISAAEVVQRVDVGAADIHAGAAAHRLQPLQHLDIGRGIGIVLGRRGALAARPSERSPFFAMLLLVFSSAARGDRRMAVSIIRMVGKSLKSNHIRWGIDVRNAARPDHLGLCPLNRPT